MAKQNFSSSVGASLNGRGNVTPQAVTSADPVPDVKPDTPDKKKPGRKKKASYEKKKQMVLTLSPETYTRLLEWASSRPRTAPNYLSEFVEEHLEEIINII